MKKLISFVTLLSVIIALFAPCASYAAQDEYYEIYILNETFDESTGWNGTYHADEGIIGLHANAYGDWKNNDLVQNWTPDRIEKGEIYYEFDYKMNGSANLRSSNSAKIGLRDAAYANAAVDFFIITPAGAVRKGSYGSDPNANQYVLTKDEWYSFKIFLNTETGDFEVYIAEKDSDFTEKPLFTSDGRYAENNPAKNGIRGITFTGFYSNNSERELDVAFVDNIRVYKLGIMPKIESVTDDKGNEVIDFNAEYLNVKLDKSASEIIAENVELKSGELSVPVAKTEVDEADDTIIKIYPADRLISASEYVLIFKEETTIGTIILPKPMTASFVTKNDVVDIADVSFEMADMLTFSGLLCNGSEKEISAVVAVYTEKDGLFTGLSFESYTVPAGESISVAVKSGNAESGCKAYAIVFDSWQTRAPLFDKRFEYAAD